MNTATAIKMRLWSTTRDAYAPPEEGPRIVGNRAPDDKRVVTSPVVKGEGRFVQTQSGTVYELVDPDPEFVAYLKAKGYPFDPENPIKLVDDVKNLTAVKGWPS